MNANINKDKIHDGYDYDKQVWIEDGKYMSCAHPAVMVCGCYGKEHAGETTTNT